MSEIFTKPDSILGQSVAQGEAGDGAIWEQSAAAMRLVDNYNSASVALEATYDDWIERVYAATGNRLENPMIVREGTNRAGFFDDLFSVPGISAPFGSTRGRADGIARQRSEFKARVLDLAITAPDGFLSDWAQFDPDKAAARRAGEADQRLGELMASRPDWWKNVVGFGGALAGSLNDPFQVATLLVGGGTSAAKTAIGRVLSVALREAAINAGVETLMQPQVQAWRAKAGLNAGLAEALQNVAFAGAGGALLGGSFAGIGEGVRGLKNLGGGGRPFADAAAQAGAPDNVVAALGDDMEANAQLLTPVRENLKPEARGALDGAEAMNGEARLLDELVAENRDNGIVQFDDNRALATAAANGDEGALTRLVAQDDNFTVKEPNFSPPPRDPFPQGLDDPFLKTELEAFTARFGDQFDEATMALPALNENGDVVSLADVLDEAGARDDLASLVTACRG